MNKSYNAAASYRPLHRHAPKKVVKPVNFTCIAPQARSVILVGDFNGWNPLTTPMRQMTDGAWRVTVEMAHGHHRYLFIVDEVPQLDPEAMGIARSDRNERVSLIAVS